MMSIRSLRLARAVRAVTTQPTTIPSRTFAFSTTQRLGLKESSNQAVRADRASREHTPEQLRELQERTKKAAEETTKAGTSMRDGL
ncbi:hypothetical protein A9Z42_0090120 [Trichoderma parareesei]|uniref:Uncharacterized protein n=1 Tax=Trichoderma parareesei TaxID=858221 RepID=A0A2H2ZMY5_TRIPA|nr:hypothetical protein A9Z42_0090120 [Trichoderma parareesei]